MTFREILAKYEAQISKLEKENVELKKKLAEKPKTVEKIVEVPVEKIVEKIVEVPVERKVEVVCPSGKVYYSEPESEIITSAETENVEMLDCELPTAKPKRSRRKKDEPLFEE